MNSSGCTSRNLFSLLSAVVLLALAGGVAGWLVISRPQPPMEPDNLRLPRVQVAAVEPVRFEEPIVGYGTVRPARQVKIIPEVTGRLIEVHPDLAVGNVIRKGELLFRIDARMYESRKSQIEAEIRRLEAELDRHARQEAYLADQLALSESQQELTARAVQRERDLMERGAAVEVDLERTKQRHLAQQEAVQTYRNHLEMIPFLVKETDALLTIKRAQLAEAELNIDHAVIYSPFDARVDAVGAQMSQVVTAHFQIATLTDMEVLELAAAIDPRDLQWVDHEAFASAVGADIGTAPEAEVVWTLWGREFSWKGRITRLERLDEATRTAHVVVELRDVMSIIEQARNEKRMPLSVGMFCKASLPVEPIEDALVIPRHAIRDGQNVYVFEPSADDPAVGRLVLKSVPILRASGEQVLVGCSNPPAALRELLSEHTCELNAGDLIIVSPLPKAVPGMQLARRDLEDALREDQKVAWGERVRLALSRSR